MIAAGRQRRPLPVEKRAERQRGRVPHRPIVAVTASNERSIGRWNRHVRSSGRCVENGGRQALMHPSQPVRDPRNGHHVPPHGRAMPRVRGRGVAGSDGNGGAGVPGIGHRGVRLSSRRYTSSHPAGMPPGAIGSQQLQRGGPFPGFFQPVEIKAPDGVLISLAEEGRFGEPQKAPIRVGLLDRAGLSFAADELPAPTRRRGLSHDRDHRPALRARGAGTPLSHHRRDRPRRTWTWP